MHQPPENTIQHAQLFRHPLVKLLLAALFAVYFGAAAPSRITSYQDGALYVGLAHNMIRGEGYSFHFEPHVMVPPVFPAMVAMVIGVLGENFLAINLLSTLAAFVAFLGIWVLIEEFSGEPGMGAMVAILCGSTLIFFIAASSTLTGMVYTAIMILALAAALRWIREARIVSASCIACIALSVLAYLTRYVGVAVIMSISLGLLLTPERGVRGRRVWLKVCVYLVVVLLPIMCWHARNYVVAPEGRTYLSDPVRILTRPEHLAEETNRLTVTQGLTRIALWRPYGFLRNLGHNMVYIRTLRFGPFWFGIGLLTLIFLLASLRKGYSILLGYCLCSGGIHVLMSRPAVVRYLVPLLPFGFYFLISGVKDLCAWFREKQKSKLVIRSGLVVCTVCIVALLLHRYARPVLFGLSSRGLVAFGFCVVVLGVFLWLQFGPSQRCELFLKHAHVVLAITVLTCNFYAMVALRVGPLNELPCVSEEYIKGMEWIRDNSDSHDVVLGNAALIPVVTRRKLVTLPISDGEELWQRVKEAGVRFIIVHDRNARDRQYLMPAVGQIRGRLILRKRFYQVQVYEVKREAIGHEREGAWRMRQAEQYIVDGEAVPRHGLTKLVLATPLLVCFGAVAERNVESLPQLLGAGMAAMLGARVMICKGVTIGEGAVVGANSVVTHDVPAYTVVAGPPARVIGKRS